MQNHSEWIPIFKTGTHTDSSGNEKTWTESDLDQIVTKYNPSEHEAPVVIGHPKDNSPAWGWVGALKRDGQMLYAKFKDLVPEFVDMVRKGLFKKRSISLYPDMSLRHVGFLGATPPAVKGLPDVAFQSGDGQIEVLWCAQDGGGAVPPAKGGSSSSMTHNPDGGGAVPRERQDSNNFCQKEVKRMKWFDWLKGKASAEGVTLDDVPGNFNDRPQQMEIKPLIDAEVAKVLEAKKAEFAEQMAKVEAEKERIKIESERLKKLEAERLKSEINSFCEGLCKEGKLTPAMLKHGMGMANFLETISGITTTIEFTENNEKKKQTPFEYIKSFLSTFKKQIEFGEFAGNDKDIPNGNDKLEALIRDYQEKHKATYKEAVMAISKQYPALFRRA